MTDPGQPGEAAPELSVGAVMAEAEARSGLSDWGDRGFVEVLELLVGSCLRSAALNRVGRDVLHRFVVRHLRNRLALRAFLASNPEAGLPPVLRPVVVTGLPRTGTTLLHNLLALDPAHRYLRLWEALRPVPAVAGGDPAVAEEEGVAEADRWLERLYALSPEFRVIHPGTAGGPEECDALFQNSFASQHLDDMFRAEDYSAWLAGATLAAEYAYYALQLRVIGRTDDRTRSWVLKAPSHLGYLATLLDTFPDALVVQCHRDPLEAVPSYASLVLAVRSPYSDGTTPAEAGAHALRRCTAVMERALADRAVLDPTSAGDSRFADVGYRELAGDPIGVVRRLYARLGRDLGSPEEGAMRRWLAANPRDRHGVHRYSAAQFGLRPEAISECMAPYRHRFAAELGP